MAWANITIVVCIKGKTRGRVLNIKCIRVSRHDPIIMFKAGEEEVAHFQILHQRILIQIVVGLPDNTADLRKISGVGKKTIEKYGEELVQLVSAYREKHGIDTVVLPEPEKLPEENTTAKKEAPHPDTKQTSLDMFNNGLTIARIA